MNFTDALKSSKTGAVIALDTWDEGKFVFYTPEVKKAITDGRIKFFGSEITYSERMSIRTPDGTVSDWRPSTNETQAVNWATLE